MKLLVKIKTPWLVLLLIYFQYIGITFIPRCIVNFGDNKLELLLLETEIERYRIEYKPEITRMSQDFYRT